MVLPNVCACSVVKFASFGEGMGKGGRVAEEGGGAKKRKKFAS